MPEHKSAKALVSPLFSRKTVTKKLAIQIPFLMVISLDCCMDHNSRAAYMYWSTGANGTVWLPVLWWLFQGFLVYFCIALSNATRTYSELFLYVYYFSDTV